MAGNVRLFVNDDLGQGQSVSLSRPQAHYLFGVMRLELGAQLLLFNRQDGEWAAEVTEAGKRGGQVLCLQQQRPLAMPPDLWLLFAPIKKARTDFIVEKAVEMGVRRICPVLTEFTNAERVKQERLQAHAVEAAEQCGATYVPEVAAAEKFDRVLGGWDPARRIMFCNEGLAGSAAPLPGGLAGASWAVLIGPEGGFSQPERARLAKADHAHGVSLGPRILRADTAAVAALTLWQTQLGDWR